MKYQIEVNREDCIRCGSCYGLDPAHFESDSDGKSQVIDGTANGKSTGTFGDEKMVEAQARINKKAESDPHYFEIIKFS